MDARKRGLVFLSLWLVAGWMLAAAGLTGEQQGWLSKAFRQERNGWIFLHIEGKPFARGFQHGFLLAREIAECLRVEKFMDWWNTGKEFPFFIEQTLRMFQKRIDPEYREEMEGIVAGACQAGVEVSYGEIVTLNASMEIVGYWYPWLREKEKQPHKSGGCSAFIATGKATADGSIVMVHNTWTHYVFTNWNVIIDLLPDKGCRMLMQGFPGGIHSSTDFFVCSSGLIGTETTISWFKEFDPHGIPEFIRIRRAMQYAGNLDECLKIMITGNNGGYANSWLFGDIHTNEIARLELGLRYHRVERTHDGFYAGSNITQHIPLLRQETEDDFDDLRESNIARRVRWLQLFDLYSGKIDVATAKTMLGDHVDVYLKKEVPDSRTICGHGELDAGDVYAKWSKPFEPSGALDGKVVDARLARQMSFWAKWGSSCDIPFEANTFLREHRQYDYLEGYLKDRPVQPWNLFQAASR